MRILQATDCYPPPLVGGRDLHVRMLSHELVRRGHEVEVASLAGLEGARTEMDGDIPVHRIAGWSRALNRFYANPRQPFHPTIADPGMVRSLAELVRRFQPEVVHVHSWILHSFLPFLPSNKTRLVVTMHEYGLVCPKNTFVYKEGTCDGPRFAKCVACASDQYGAVRSAALTTGLTVTRRARHRVDRYIAVSTPVAQACAPLAAGGGSPITVIPPFLGDDSFSSIEAARPCFVPPTGDYVMFAGALAPHKGVDVLLEAYKDFDPAVPLVLVGLRSAQTPLGFPDNVIVAENVPHSDVLRAWEHCSVAVVPSRWPDPCPLVVLEAMAAGRPVVASAVGGIPDMVVDGATGVLVPPNDVVALRAAIAGLLADPGLRTRMGQAGRERANGYSANAIVPQIERVYDEAISASRSLPNARGGMFSGDKAGPGPRVSILSPTYQHAAFIGDCVRSVLAQTMQDWEMIIVDDGSDDGTADIAESFDDPRIVVLRRRHEGVVGLCGAYTAALAKASSPFVAILEGDDTWPTTKLADQLPLFTDPGVVLAYGSAGLMDQDGHLYARHWHAPRGKVGSNDPIGTILPALVNVNFIVAATVMIRRAALERIGGFFQPTGIPYVDHPTWLRLATTGRFAKSSKVLGYWRRYARQVTTRSWFATDLDREPYMQAIADEARGVVSPDVLAALAASTRRDPFRQREEARIAHGRVALLEGRWRQAAEVFAQLLRTGEPRTRVVAAAGLLCAGTRTDLEPIIGAMGRHSLPSRRHLSSHADSR